jgi:hypothetical protein
VAGRARIIASMKEATAATPFMDFMEVAKDRLDSWWSAVEPDRRIYLRPAQRCVAMNDVPATTMIQVAADFCSEQEQTKGCDTTTRHDTRSARPLS